MRTLLGCMFVVAFGGWLVADDKKDEKIDGKKLIGKWIHEDKDGSRVVVEFTKDGKVMTSMTYKGETQKVEGTYKLEGAKLALVLKDNGKEQKETSTVLKVTDTELVLTEGNGMKVAFTRMKGK